MPSTPTDLVTDTKFRVEFNSNLVYRFTVHSSTAPDSYMRRQEKVDVWKEEKSIGNGSYGSVRLHRCLTSKDEVQVQAVKAISKKSLSFTGINFLKELEAIAKFSQQKVCFYYPFIVPLLTKYFGWYENEDSVFIVMEYIRHGDLGSYLEGPFPENEAREVTFQVAEGLEHLHENDFVHRDLKPENVFVVRRSPQWWVKIGDFGFSKRIKEDSSLQSMVGTRLYLAPEIQMLYPPGVEETSAMFHYSAKVDIWSLGVMVFYMLFHDFPFTLKSPHGLPKYVNGGPFPFPTSTRVQISEDARKFILDTMKADAELRLSARETLNSGWMKRRQGQAAGLRDTSRPIQSENNQSTAKKMPSILSEPVHSTATSRSHVLIGSKKSREHQPVSSKMRQNPKQDSKPVSNNKDPLTAAHEMGKAEYEQGNYAQAEAFFRQAFEGRTKSLGGSHEDTLTALEWLGRSLYDGKQYSKAEAAFRWTIDARTKSLGASHPDTLTSLGWLGRSLYCHENYDEAVSTLRHVYEGQEKVLGASHQQTLDTLLWLGRALYWHEDYSQAVGVCRRVFKYWEQSLGPSNEQTIESLFWLGRSQYWNENYAEAVLCFRRVHKSQELRLGRNHTVTLETAHWLGRALYWYEDYGQAVTTFRWAAEGQGAVLGETHIHTLASLDYLGRALYYHKEYAKAVVMFRKAFEGREVTLGATHHHTQESLDWLRRSLYYQKEHGQ
ncbi:hypothetical protein N7532_010623 [Penicillium argentinense]|uniref:Serine/threonine-protein kinase ATG1 n=1 Tax=Penicillium argentinense TaxID=1131581 RepID=A0A9W9EPY8_9EURO|nr:uncharacterized protein N7532_010623 [Penicillium argentinense]KAJ5085852.1 hypothetical protein N7532_010623 [Penicillium argentinense]